ncbi:MAG: 30S ribosomal protein S17 [Elusimicrobia bacterium]|nr:30S ribosomal protein S17 [Elusimicrobiota bacterium]
MAETKETQAQDRASRKLIRGIVVSDKAAKTRVIDVERRVPHRFYEKVITKRSRFYAHDENNESHAGDLVEIMSTRPLSKLKRWRVVRVIQAARRVAEIPASAEAAK